MRYPSHPTTFAGLPVVEFPTEGEPPTVEDPAAVAWRLELEFEDGPARFAELFDRFLAAFGGHTTALVIGEWGGAAYENVAPVARLAEKAAALPNLRALFLGDMIAEECEISWIQHTDITPLLAAYPGLEYLTIRGGTGLAMSAVASPALRELVVESGGLPAGVVRAVAASDLPALTTLELWLGTENYGGDATTDDLAEMLAGTRLPAITRLGLRDAEIADDVAGAVAAAPVVARLEVLDLSKGTLTDRGARSLLAGQPLTHLRELNLAYHYLSDGMMKRMVEELPGVRVDVSDQQDPDRYGPYVAVGE